MPVKHFLFIIGALVMADMYTGWRAAKKLRGEKFNSKGMGGTIEKTVLYMLAVLICRGVDLSFGMDGTVGTTYVVAGLITGRELLSNLENIGKVTGLSRSLTNSQLPGNWNNASREVAVEYYLKRAVRDLRIAYPTRRLKLLAVNWWQGENDGAGNIPSADYQRQFLEMKNYVDKAIAGLFVQDKKHIWNLTKLDYNRNAGEATINSAIDALAAAYDDIYTVNAAGYPQSDELSPSEASPVAVGAPNANGWTDDNHSSYISMLAVGEQQFANIQAAGLI
jgi:hypothetical protein